MRHTPIMIIIIIFPIAIVSLFSVLAFFAKQTELQIFRVTSLQIFFEVVFPLTITLIMGLMFRMERRNRAFQNTVIYFKNFKAYFGQNFMFHFLIGCLMILVGYTTHVLLYIVFTQRFDFVTVDYLNHVILAFIMSLPLISFIYLLNFIFQGIVMPAVISLILTIGNFFVGIIGVFGSYAYFYSFLVFNLYNGYNKVILASISIVLSCIFLLIGYVKFLKSMEKGVL